MIPRTAWSLLLLILASTACLPAQVLVTIVTPTNGALFPKAAGMELNIPLRATVANPGPFNRRVYFYANGNEIGSASTDENYSTIWSNAAFGTHVITAMDAQAGSAINAVTIHVQTNGIALVSERSVWKYLDGGVDPGPAWFAADTDLSLWLQGLPQFGFGEGDEQTVLNWMNQSDSTVFPVYYFRTAFQVTNAPAGSNLLIRLLRDDGAVVYLNGQEILRDNMPNGSISNDTYALAGAREENTFTDYWVNPGRLVEGTNHLAVSVHNQGSISHDISFDARLLMNLSVPPPRLTVLRQGSEFIMAWPLAWRGYRLESAGALASGSWSEVTNVVASATEFRSTNLMTQPALFFRLAL
jgi:hypothetical protein